MSSSGTKPPYTNRGVPSEKRKISCTLDWLAFTVADIEELKRFLAVMDWTEIDPPEKTPKPRGFYKQALQGQLWRAEWNNQRPELKVFVRMTGAQIAEYTRQGGSQERLLGVVSRLRGLGVTRLDFAVDVRGEEIDIEALYKDAREGEIETPARKYRYFAKGDGETEAQTTYIGSRMASRMMRIYDKAAQQKKDGLWTRVEMEAKKPYAGRLIGAMVSSGISVAGRQAMRDYAKIDAGWYKAATEGIEVEIAVGERKKTNRQLWLEEVALPAVCLAIASGDINAIRNVELALETAKHGS